MPLRVLAFGLNKTFFYLRQNKDTVNDSVLINKLAELMADVLAFAHPQLIRQIYDRYGTNNIMGCCIL